jgi:hypothetical protein
MNPKHPVYIISKGRWESRMTSKAFERMQVPYRIVVEEQEYGNYSQVIDPAKILVLEKQYQADYDPCCVLAEGQSKGSGPARNFVWDHAISEGASWHWIVDDNIRVFMRLSQNLKFKVADGTIFRCMEDFCNRYSNVAQGGPTYDEFVKRKEKVPPFVLNTRIYSCILIRNDVQMRWRGRYNEDTDLSIRMLKAGWCTVSFGAFLQDKGPTMKMKGGNTDELYAKGTAVKSQMIVAMHPDICRLTRRFGRIHHHANYRKFDHLKLVRKEGVEIVDSVDNYGMTLEKLTR